MAKIRSWSWRQGGTQSEAIGRSKGSMATIILALTDALCNLVRFVLMPGHRFDTVGVAPLIDGLAFDGFIADKAFDSNSIIADLNERGAKIVISQHPRRASPPPIDAEIYKWRHLIERVLHTAAYWLKTPVSSIWEIGHLWRCARAFASAVASGSTSFIFAVCEGGDGCPRPATAIATREDAHAIVWGLMARSTMLESISIRPSRRKRPSISAREGGVADRLGQF